MKLLRDILSGRARRTAPASSVSAAELLIAARTNLEGGEWGAAQLACEDLIRLQPDHAEALHLLGVIAYRMRDWATALELMGRSIELDPVNASFHNNLGGLLTYLGRPQDAAAALRRALVLDPAHLGARENLLFLLPSLDGVGGEELRAEHEEWARLHGAPFAALGRPHANAPDPERRLRVGYVSGDFREHAVSLFMEPVLENHDRHAVEVFCYCNNRVQDAVTARLRRSAAGWYDIAGWDDDAVAARIRSDAIDILVDLSGHLRDNRLLVFARKPAPVQIGYLGYLPTTGLATIDYRITDPLCDPPGMTESHYSERLLRLPGCMWCYKPMAAMPEVSPPPALEQGVATFASTNNPAKITDRMLELWARILHRVPGSRLLIAGTAEQGRSRMLSRLHHGGVQSERVEFRDRMAHPEFWALHRRIDVLLDTYPFNGGTTSCEALWLGVPVVSLAGRHMPARAGVSLLTHIGLADFVVSSEEQYVDVAAALGRDVPRLGALRAGMRQRIQASGLLDAPRYTRGLEDLYRAAWRAWCTRR